MCAAATAAPWCVVGPAGIGKSWLCRQAAALADGFTVVRTRGLESEAHFGHCGLFDVLSPLVEGHLERLLPARGEALRGALRMASTPVDDPFAVAVASLDLLAVAAEDAPVLVVVDDAPWVDAASLEALRFAARRLNADRVGFVFAARSEHAAAFLDAGMEPLSVGGLDVSEAVILVNEFASSEVAAPVALALAEAGREHPLWLREAVRELSPAQRTGAVPLSKRFQRARERARRVRATRARPVRAGPARPRDAGGRRTRAGAGHGAGARRSRPGAERRPGRRSIAGSRCWRRAGGGSHTRWRGLPCSRSPNRRSADSRTRRSREPRWGEPERAAWHLAAAGDGPDAQVSSALAGSRAGGAGTRRARRGGRGVAAGDRNGSRRRSRAPAAPGGRA